MTVCMCLCIFNWRVSVFWSNVFLNTWNFYTCYLENAIGLAFGEEQMRSSLQAVPESEAEDEGAGWMFFIVQGQGAQVAKKLTSGWVLVLLKGKIWDYLVSTFNISCSNRCKSIIGWSIRREFCSWKSETLSTNLNVSPFWNRLLQAKVLKIT